MNPIIISGELLAQLRLAEEPVELRDENGCLLGEFLPHFDPSQLEVIGPELSGEELMERVRNEKKYTTAEVLEHLRRLS
jgi:hypothetical protein